MSCKRVLSAIVHGCAYVFKTVKIASDGQNRDYAILQTAHRLEKGMVLRVPRANWGWEKANKLC